ncbi:MAG: NAD(P)H-binding protein [Pseudomonas sp.]
MKNLETPATKLAIYGASGTVGSALLVEALSRQYEVTAILSDLNALPSRPGIRTQQGNLFDALSVSQNVAGKDAVICVLCSECLPAGTQNRSAHEFEQVYDAVSALLDGLALAGVRRLLLVDGFAWLDEADDGLPQPAHHLQNRLLDSQIAWTLVDTPAQADERLSLGNFLHPSDVAVHGLRQFAAGLLDELMLALHVRQRIRIYSTAEEASL